MTAGDVELAGAGPEALSAGTDEAARREAGVGRGTAMLSDRTGINDSGPTDTAGTSGRAGAATVAAGAGAVAAVPGLEPGAGALA
jgi:hypothetical protein